ncbi:MAG: hypothetical protein M1834_001628 [Cirrosporium novae-zelandiae]|nr:MAG: hypothetical protein M1834_004145 [Cirrosporium novae-zelandiae]KAI9735612.1 MAG: hypothetical protein M1834_001628 [Cirrosporium novae-zelandiae]
MAYSRGYNPDALPAHAEPEEAAAILSGHQRPHSQSSSGASGPPRLSPAPSNAPYRPPRSSPTWQNRPQPPIPQNQQSYYGASAGAAAHDPRGGRVGCGSNGHYSPRLTSPPPPQNYGYGPRPTYNNLPPSSSLPPSNTGPPPLTDPTTTPPDVLFRTANLSGNGYLTEPELSSALRNSDYTSFDPSTVHMMMRMFSHDDPNSYHQTLTLPEFSALLSFLSNWHTLFTRFDADGSLSISLHEFSSALQAFGYRVSPQFVELLFRTFDKKMEGRLGFDLFVQACISLKRMTDVFKRFDEDRDGYVTLSFEEFLTGKWSPVPSLYTHPSIHTAKIHTNQASLKMNTNFTILLTTR